MQYTLDFKKYGGGKQTMSPQEGPQENFIRSMSGMSGQPLRDQDFPLAFYGGAR